MSAIETTEPRPLNVVITGASAGVGRATARCFAERDGANIGLIARGRGRLDSAAEDVRSRGGTPLVLPCDVSDWEAVDAAANRFEDQFGPIDVWINCAMVTMLAPFEQIEPAEFRRITEVTYLGYVHGTLAALRRMRPHDRGVIVQVGSALAYRSIPLQSAYCGAKHAIVGFTDSIRSELIHDGSVVQISAVHLPAVNTPQFDWMRNRMPNRPQPVPPIYQPEVPADAIHHVAHHPQRELWVGRSAVMTILGQKLAPELLDEKLADAAYSGQQTDERASERPDNLFDPVEGDYSAHGRFDDRATYHAPALAAAKQRPGPLVAGLAALGGVALAAYLLSGRGRDS
ncbi:Short-chain dehydrogenase [Palleronia marisminoris]|uniref:Fatty acyl-CoA reductase n=1 Tax=Palleronia marisminoris TaxID=315423 RepID=A0A1Y5SBV2_9RHOB|nr:SDR family oxidoreductase [Palleronia marisminoris]SFG72907.1 Short-chain dehydrogenase [Palleronia marisminoris]SLN37247.1 Fatty acyl-CoA reductase [Palleronia marisminoris]